MRPPMCLPLAGTNPNSGSSDINLLAAIGEDWATESGTIPENPDTGVSVTAAKVVGWNYGAETLPRLNYKAGFPEDVLEIERNSGGASNFETDDAITADQYVSIYGYAYLPTSTNGMGAYWQTSSQAGDQQIGAAASGDDGVMEGVVTHTTATAYPGIRDFNSPTGIFQIDYFRAYAVEPENVGQGSRYPASSDIWSGATNGTAVDPDALSTTPPDGWSFGGTTAICRIAADGSTLRIDRNGASAADADLSYTFDCAEGDLLHVRCKRNTGNGAMRCEIVSGANSNLSNVNNNTEQSFRIEVPSGETSATVSVRGSTSATTSITIDYITITRVTAALRTVASA